MTLLYKTEIPYLKKSSFVTRGFFLRVDRSGRAHTSRAIEILGFRFGRNGGETETEERDGDGEVGPGVG